MLAYALFFGAVYVSGFKPIGISADIRNYELLYNASAVSDWQTILQGGDFGYYGTSKLAASLGCSFEFFAFLLAATTCSLLFVVASRLDTNRIILVAIYGSYLFWLHEYTQIRISVAIAVGLCGIYVAKTAVRWPLFILAVLFHNSFILVIFAYVVIKIRRADLIVAMAAVGLFLLFGPLGEGLVQRITAYQDLASTTGQFTSINLFSLMPLVQIAGIGCAAITFRQLPLIAKEETVLASFGVAAYYLFASLPVLAFRTFEIFMPFFVILLSRIWKISRISRVVVLLWILLGLRSAFFAADSIIIL